MSENHDISQANVISGPSQERSKRSLAASLIILVILYLITGTFLLFITSRFPTLVVWLEAGQWLLVILWLLIGVRPPFTRWLKQNRERGA